MLMLETFEEFVNGNVLWSRVSCGIEKIFNGEETKRIFNSQVHPIRCFGFQYDSSRMCVSTVQHHYRSLVGPFTWQDYR